MDQMEPVPRILVSDPSRSPSVGGGGEGGRRQNQGSVQGQAGMDQSCMQGGSGQSHCNLSEKGRGQGKEPMTCSQPYMEMTARSKLE